MNLHAEVLALQQQLGLSYKDSSHRLYMAELEKLKIADKNQKAFENLDKRIGDYLKNLSSRFVDKGQDQRSPDADEIDCSNL
jgi:hypothetical protein